MNLRIHKGFSDIEQDIHRFYEDGTVNAQLTALKIAARAMAIAVAAEANAFDKVVLKEIKSDVDRNLESRLYELECKLHEQANPDPDGGTT